MTKRTGIAAAILIFVCSLPVLPQAKNTAEVSGIVRDPSDAVIQAAKITVASPAIGVAREATTDADGEFRVLLLPPGEYEIKVEKAGFMSQSRRGLELTVGQVATLAFKLEVGASTQVIEIQGETPLIESERAQQSNTIDQQAVRNLPINRRDYLTFALLAPGVADSRALADANSFRVKQTPDSGLSFYGSNGRGNSVTIDGGEFNDTGGGVRQTVSQEVVQEFQVNRSNYSAEHGGARGGVVNIVTKSGTNGMHGSVFGFFRHQSLDAGDPFAIELRDNRIQRIKPDATRQQFGGTLGGPLKKDRTFFFAGYEQLRRRESSSVPVLTDPSIFQPTAQQNAILNQLPAPVQAQLRPAFTAPPSTIDLFVKNSGVFPFQTNDYKVMGRIDHRANDANQFALRYTFAQIHETNQNLRGQVGFSRGFVYDGHDQNGLAGWTRVLAPSLINEARVQFSFARPVYSSNDPFGPELNINGYGFFNRDIFLPSDIITRRTDIVDNLSWNHGDHSLKVGGQILLRGVRTASATFMSGRFTFGNLPAAFIPGVAQVSPALAQTQLTSLQSFNLGLPQSYQQGFGDPVVSAFHPLYGVYVQDTWRVNQKLTLNMGVRYEVDTRKEPLPTDKNNFAPRIGFAYDPTGRKRTIFRGGYGVFHAPTDFQIDYVVNALNEINGYRQIAQVLSVLNPAAPTAPNGPIAIYQTLRRQGVLTLPSPTRSIVAGDLAQFGINVSQTGPRPPLTVLFHNSSDFVNSYTQQYSFGIEHEFAPGTTVGINYIGVRGLKIIRSRDDNLLPAPVDPRLGIRVWSTPYFKNPLLFQDNVYESSGKSWYNGMILEFTRRFSRSMTLAANYTFSKAQDMALDYNSDFQANDQTNLNAEKSLSAFDQRHKVVFYGVFTTGAGGTATGWEKLKGGWVFTPIFRANSARPFNLLVGSELNQDRHSTTDRPPYAGRNTGIGPAFYTFDMRLSRRFAVREGVNLEVIGEMFNLANHLNYTTVNNVVGAIAGPFNLAGRPDRTPSEPLGFTAAQDARRIQLGIRLNW